MVGETRDGETAGISVRAAITGHLVLSTLHTNDAVSSIVRPADMGIDHYLIANSLVGLVAQRLMRKVCPHCGREVTSYAAGAGAARQGYHDHQARQAVPTATAPATVAVLLCMRSSRSTVISAT